MIETQRLLIDEFTLEDAEALSGYRCKEEVSYYQSWNHYPLVKAKKRIEYCIKNPFRGQPGNYQLAVRLRESRALIGDYFLEVHNSSKITLGYTFDSEYWSHGYATESLRALLEYLKTTYQFKTVYCHVYSDNERSLRLLENNGFKEYEHSSFMGDVGYRKDL